MGTDADGTWAPNGGLRRASALRINLNKHWTGDQLSEKVSTGPKQHARLLEAYFGVVGVIINIELG